MHPRRRLGPSTGRGVVASAAAAGLVLLGGCSSGPPQIEEHDLSGADRAACEALVDDLPDTLAGEPSTPVEPDGALGAAWGDPAYVLTCGVPEPEDYEPTAECNVVAGVGWYVPDDELSDPSEDATAIALSRTPYVAVLVPEEHRTEGIDRALAELAPVLEEHLGEGLPCL
ncbi:DUF3515 domain-containing protein [Microbacterium sp. ARD31]|uniref:DUF3515 domain-containing protein n=1 Tax=Microbacterium sp. ARD31 TaxID=2962576 RepID=UPI002880E63F|nr:DUF3515 domain-containing protein [Microbacterium sp. ARD31]MDT0183904.1 DUF3515 domain-containing protein [Microbacterium sp. ARD31]